MNLNEAAYASPLKGTARARVTVTDGIMPVGHWQAALTGDSLACPPSVTSQTGPIRVRHIKSRRIH